MNTKAVSSAVSPFKGAGCDLPIDQFVDDIDREIICQEAATHLSTFRRRVDGCLSQSLRCDQHREFCNPAWDCIHSESFIPAIPPTLRQRWQQLSRQDILTYTIYIVWFVMWIIGVVKTGTTAIILVALLIATSFIVIWHQVKIR